ncbi:MAG: WcaI family glycosyltransferase [Nibricoccus sp.]
MKITVWGINYDPEPTGIGPFNTDLCAYLVEQGHSVTMLSTFPYYPWWKKRDADRGKFYAKEQRPNGVVVHRCWHYVPAKPTTLKRLVHELSFVATSTWKALFSSQPDLYIVVSPSLFLGLGATLVKWLRRRRFVYHVQDLQPDAALGLGMIKPGLSVRALYALEKWNYSRAAVVSGISQGMMDAFERKGVPAYKTYLLPNWIPEANGAAPNSSNVSFRKTCGIAPETPLIAYSGNLGVKQGLDVVVEAAMRVEKSAGAESRAIHWAICGEGAAKPALQKTIADHGCRTVHLYPLQSDELYQSLLCEANVCLITQQKGTGQFFFPSKLLSILQLGRSVLAVADDSSELARAVKEGGFGIVVPSGDAAALVEAVNAMAFASQQTQQQWSANALGWVDQFRRSRVLGALEENLKEIVASRGELRLKR